MADCNAPSCDPKLIAANETLLLKTRIRYGRVSYEKPDVHFRYGDWKIPQHISEDLKSKKEYRSTRCGDLFIISDEKDNLRASLRLEH